MTTMLEISRSYWFDSAHHLPEVPDGHKCKRPHGHTWQCRIWVRGDVDRTLGWVVDYAELDAAWDKIAAQLDHRDLNELMPNPTTEHLIYWIYVKFQEALGERVNVAEVELCEGESGRTRLRVPMAGEPVG